MAGEAGRTLENLKNVMSDALGSNSPQEELGPRADSPAMQYRRMMAGRASMPQQMQQPTMPGGKGANALTMMEPRAPEITPAMRQAALQQFESQRGAGVVPYQMRPYMGADQEGVNPAFQYAAQNYARLGGDQRLAPRPMEMMSVAERQQINDMSQAMADQQAQTEFDSMRDLFQRGNAGKGSSQRGNSGKGLRNELQDRMQNPNTAPTAPTAQQLPVGGIMSLLGRGR